MAAEPTYGEFPTWHPERPSFGVTRVLLTWFVASASLLVAAWIVPDVAIDELRRRRDRRGAHRGPERAAAADRGGAAAAVHARSSASCSILVLDALMLLWAADITAARSSVDSFWLALLAALVASAVSVVLEVALRDERRRHVHDPRHPARSRGGRASASETDVPGIVFLEIDGLALPVLQRAMRDGNAPTMARWLAEGTPPRSPSGRPTSRRRRARSQAGILLGSNEDIPAFRWVEKETGTLMTCSAPRRLRRDRAPARDGRRPARRRRREPGEPALGRGRPRDPHGQPDRGREEGEPRLPGVLRQRLQRHARRSCSSSGRSCSSGRPRCARSRRDVRAARPPRRHLPVPARGDVRRRPRPDRLRRADRHDEGAPRDLRDVLELRRGRAPLGPRARRHARGAAQARPAVRADRPRPPATRRGRTRSSSSPTTARRRARRSSSATATGSTSSSSARSTTARSTSVAGGDEQHAMVGHAVGRGDRQGRRSRRSARRTT